MITIKTKFLPATDYLGERISVNFGGQIKRYSYDYALNGTENHVNAIYKAIKDLGKGVNREYAIFKAYKNNDFKHYELGTIFSI